MKTVYKVTIKKTLLDDENNYINSCEVYVRDGLEELEIPKFICAIEGGIIED